MGWPPLRRKEWRRQRCVRRTYQSGISLTGFEEREPSLEDMGDASDAFIQVGGSLRKEEVAGYRALKAGKIWAFPVPKQTNVCIASGHNSIPPSMG